MSTAAEQAAHCVRAAEVMIERHKRKGMGGVKALESVGLTKAQVRCLTAHMRRFPPAREIHFVDTEGGVA